VVLDLSAEEAACRKDEILRAVKYLCGKDNPVRRYQGGEIHCDM